MKKLVLGSLALAAMLATPAMAADMPVKAKAPPPPPPVYDWSGFYLGVGIGGAWSETSVSNIAGPPFHFYTALGETDVHTRDNFAYEGFIGVQGQWGAWVLGAEVAVKEGYFRNDILVTAPLAGPLFSPVVRSVEIKDIWTVVGKLGYAMDRWLGYVKAGWAAASYHTNATERPFFLHDGASQAWHTGYTFGVGFDYALDKILLVGVEYNYIALDTKDQVGQDSINFAPYAVRVDPRDIQTLMGRLTIKFNPFPPAPPPPPPPVKAKS